MSGGSMDYLCHRVENDANFRLDSPERIAFKSHLQKVAKALHDIEWVDSGDYGPGRDLAAIMACITPTDVLSAAIEKAIEARTSLDSAIDRATGAIAEGRG